MQTQEDCGCLGVQGQEYLDMRKAKADGEIEKGFQKANLKMTIKGREHKKKWEKHQRRSF